MDQYITGAVIKDLRKKNNMTQQELAEVLNVSDKSISKWETGRGYPDITLLEPLAGAFKVSVTELLSGNAVTNMNISANMLRSKFYVCPICGNVIHSMGEAVISCHGIQLLPEEAEEAGDSISVERVEDDHYITVDHPMTKSDYISFIAVVSYDSVEIKKLYPEGPAEARFMITRQKKVYFYSNRDGLFYRNI